MITPTLSAATLARPGGAALALLNTLNWRLSDQPTDLLDPLALLEALRASDQAHALPRSLRLPLASSLAYRILHRDWSSLRELLWQILAAHCAGVGGAGAAHARLSDHWAAARNFLQLDTHSGALSMRVRSADEVTHVLVYSFLSLLALLENNQLKVCADARGCGWLFVDDSKNQLKRYCSPACGSYARQKRFQIGA